MIVDEDGTPRDTEEIVAEMVGHLSTIYAEIQSHPQLEILVYFSYGCKDHGHEGDFCDWTMDWVDLILARFYGPVTDSSANKAGRRLAEAIVPRVLARSASARRNTEVLRTLIRAIVGPSTYTVSSWVIAAGVDPDRNTQEYEGLPTWLDELL